MASRLDRRPGAAPRPQGKTEEDEGLHLSFIQVLASALAAVSGAIVTSAFGVAGTITGAAVMSLIATSATAVYSHSIKRTSRMLRQPLHPDAGQRSRAGAGHGGTAKYGGTAEYGGARYGHYGGAAGEEGHPGRGDAGYGEPAGGGYGTSAAGGYGGPASVYGRPADAGYGRPASGERGRSAAAGDAAPAGGPHDPGDALGAEGVQGAEAEGREGVAASGAHPGSASTGKPDAAGSLPGDGPATTSAGASRTDGGEKGAERSASDQPPAAAARPGYTAPRTYAQGRRLNRKVGLALGIVLTFVIALGTLTIIELITGESSAGLWGQGGNGPSIIGGGDTSAPSPKPTSPASSPAYTGTPTQTSTSTPSPTSTATRSATSSPTVATSTPARTPSPTATSSAQLKAPSPTARAPSPSAAP